jgi:hypothetical protein
MTITFLESGGSATYGLQGWGTVVGTATADASVVHGQPRSIKCVGASAMDSYVHTSPLAVFGDAGGRVSAYIQMGHHDDVGYKIYTSGGDQLVNTQTDGGTSYLNGKLRVQLGPTFFDSTLLMPLANTWFRLSCAFTLTSVTVNEWRFWIDGVLYITASNVNITGFQITPRFLLLHGDNGTSFPAYFSDIYVDDSTALTDPGDIRVTAKQPGTVNANNFDTTGGTGAVNERALSETNYRQQAGTGQVAQNYAIQAAAAGDVDVSAATIVGYGSWIWAKGTAGGAGTPKITNNGTDTAITLTASPAHYRSPCVISATYPANAATVGMVSTGATDDTFLYEAGMFIAYTPGGAGGGGGLMWLWHHHHSHGCSQEMLPIRPFLEAP